MDYKEKQKHFKRKASLGSLVWPGNNGTYNKQLNGLVGAEKPSVIRKREKAEAKAIQAEQMKLTKQFK